MRRHFYSKRDDADHACEVLRTFGLLPFMAVALLDDLEQWEVCCDVPAQQSYAEIAARVAYPEPSEDDFQQSSWWDEYGAGRRYDRD